MRSITFKLTLAFLLVGLIGSVLVAVILQVRTRVAFNRFIVNREQEFLISHLAGYYEATGSWTGVESSLPAYLLNQLRDPSLAERDLRRQGLRFILAGSDRSVIFSPLPGQQGQVLARGDMDGSIPIWSGGRRVGWLLPVPGTRQWVPESPEARFIQELNTVMLTSAGVAAVLALAFGGLLAFTLTRSLREMTEATNEIAQGKLGRQVKVRSNDELGDLAQSFNRMSTDLARATDARRQMTADIAHDLRSPLSVLAGYAEALTDGKLDGSPEIYSILHQETRHLSRLIDDLRTLSLVDAGELSLILQPIHPQELLDRVAARHAVSAANRGLALAVEAAPGLPLVHVDVERFAQVLDNLILNAFRYTPAGGQVRLSAAQSDPGRIQIQVQDTGQGISAEDLPKIFDRFYRGDAARQHTGESGLGLAIARSLVRAHGGALTAASAVGQGTTFTITLDLK